MSNQYGEKDKYLYKLPVLYPAAYNIVRLIPRAQSLTTDSTYPALP